MASAADRLARPLSRRTITVVLPAVYLVLTLFFVLMRFPYEHVAGGVVEQVEESTGMRLEIEELGPYLGLLGPGFQAHNVVAVPREGGMIQIDRLRLRPAWSLSWFRGDPAVHVGVRSPVGEVDGAVVIGDPMGFDGSVTRVDLSAPAVRDWMPIDGLDGRLTATGDLAFAEGVPLPEGDLELLIEEGSVVVPGSPLAIPFDRIEGGFVFGGESKLRSEGIQVTGPMLDATASGRLGDGNPGARWSRAQLELEVELQVKEPVARSALRGAGVRLERDGTATFEIGGTLSSPQIR